MAFSFEILVKAIDQATTTLKNVAKEMDKIGKQAPTTTSKWKAAMGALKDGVLSTYGPMLTLAGGVTAVGGAVAAAGKFVADSITDWVAYNEEIRKLSEATGASTSDLSRLVQAADDVGVSMESMKTALRLAAQNGVAPTVENLARLSDELRGIQDATKRAERMQAIFGRGWAEVAGFMLKGGDAIREMTGAIDESLVVTAESAQQAREHAAAVDELRDSWTSLSYTVAKEYAPAVTSAIQVVNDFLTEEMKAKQMQDQVQKAFDDGKLTLEEYTDAWYGLQRSVYTADQVQGKYFQEVQTTYTPTVEALARAYEQSLPAMGYYAAAQKEVRDATMEVDDAMKKYSASLLFNKAAANLSKDAAFELARKLGLVDERTVALTEVLPTLEDMFINQKDSIIPLDTAAGNYTTKLASINQWLETMDGKTVTAQMILDFLARNRFVGGSGGGPGGRGGTGGPSNILPEQAGGPVRGGERYIVGEMGPELFVPTTSGYIVPNHAVGNTTNNWSLTINEAGRRGNVREDFALLKALAEA